MYLSVQFTIASAGKVMGRARRTERRPSGESWAIWPGSPIKGLPGYTILSLIMKTFFRVDSCLKCGRLNAIEGIENLLDVN